MIYLALTISITLILLSGLLCYLVGKKVSAKQNEEFTTIANALRRERSLRAHRMNWDLQ